MNEGSIFLREKCERCRNVGNFNDICNNCLIIEDKELIYTNFIEKEEKKMAIDTCLGCGEDVSDSGSQLCPTCMKKALSPEYGGTKEFCLVCKKDLTGSGRHVFCLDCSKKNLIRVGPEEFVEESVCSHNKDRCLICSKEMSGTGKYTICSECTNKALKTPGPVDYAKELCTGPEEYLVGVDVSSGSDFFTTEEYYTSIEEYQTDAARMIDKRLNYMSQLQEGVMGLCGEAGEASELVKKHLFQGHELNNARVAKELGDALWYLTEAASAIGYSLEEIMLTNIVKSKERYPDGFTSEKSIERKDIK